MTDLEAQIPQSIKDIFHHLFGMGGQFVGQQEHQIDVGKRRQFAAAVAAGGGEGKNLAGGRVGQWVNAAEREVIERPDQLIHQVGVGARYIAAARAVFLEPAADLGPAVAMGGFEYPENPALCFRRITGPPDKLLKLSQKRLAVDDVAGFRYLGHGLLLYNGGDKVIKGEAGIRPENSRREAWPQFLKIV